MSRCDVCMRDVDDGVSCGECGTDADEEQRAAAENIAAWIDARATWIDNLRNLHPDWYDDQALARHAESATTCRAIAAELRDGTWRQDVRPPGDGYCECGEHLDKEHSHGVD